jgi:hypothetical protein
VTLSAEEALEKYYLVIASLKQRLEAEIEQQRLERQSTKITKAIK